MRSGATTIPCPHCGAQVPAGARFCGDCGKAIAPTRQMPRPDDITVVDPSGALSPTPSRQMPRPDDVTVIEPPAPVPPAPSRGRQPPRPDDLTVVDPPAEGFQAAPSRSMPRPDDLTVVDPPGGPSAAVYPAFSGPQPVAAPLGRPPVISGGQPLPPLSTQFPIISGKFPLKKRTVFTSKGGRIALIALVLLVIAGGISLYFIVQSINRHGLPSDIPLPDNASYVMGIEQLPQNHADEAWFYTVNNTQPSQIISFYQAQLPSNGWGNIIQHNGSGSPGAMSSSICGFKSNKEVYVSASANQAYEGVSPPSGGVALEIILGPYPYTGMPLCS